MDVDRPIELTIIPIIFFVFAVLGISLGIKILPEALPHSHLYVEIFSWISMFQFLQSLGMSPLVLIAQYTYLGNPIGRILFEINILNIIYGVFVIIPTVYAISGIGLLSIKKWGRYLALITGVVSITIGLFSLLLLLMNYSFRLYIGLILLLIGIIVIPVLMGDIKYAFEQIEVETLVRDLSQGIKELRISAAKVLRVVGGERAVEPLIQALEDSEWRVRAEAAKALGYIRDERAVKPLFQALNDKHKYVRAVAKRALIKIIVYIKI